MELRWADASWQKYSARMTNAGKAWEVKPAALKNRAGKHRSVRKEKIKIESLFSDLNVWVNAVSGDWDWAAGRRVSFLSGQPLVRWPLSRKRPHIGLDLGSPNWSWRSKLWRDTMWGEQGREDWSGKKWESRLSMTIAHIKLFIKTNKTTKATNKMGVGWSIVLEANFWDILLEELKGRWTHERI